MPQGTATVNFGSGQFVTSVDVTGQTDILSGSLVEAWLFPISTADHSADEHIAEGPNIRVIAGSLIAGAGFTIHAYAVSPPEPLSMPGQARLWQGAGSTAGQNTSRSTPIIGSDGGRMVLLTGSWTVAWCWSSGTGVPGGEVLLGTTTLGADASSITVSGLALNPGKPLRIHCLGLTGLASGSSKATFQVNGASVRAASWFGNENGSYGATVDSSSIFREVFSTLNTETEVNIVCPYPGVGRYRHFYAETGQVSGQNNRIAGMAHFEDTATVMTSFGLSSADTLFYNGFFMKVYQAA